MTNIPAKFSVFVMLLLMGSICHSQTDSLKIQKHLNDSRFMLGSGVVLTAAGMPMLAFGIHYLKMGVLTERYGMSHDFRPSGRILTGIGSVTTAAGIILIAIGAKGVYEIHHHKTTLDVGLLDDNTLGLQLSF